MRITAALVLLASTVALAQKPAPPDLGSLVSYQYWPSQFIQFVTGPELPYSMFEFDEDTSGKQPVYHAVLTGKDGTRTHFSNTDAMATYYKATGETSFKVDFAVDSDDSEKVGATTTVRFAGPDEKAVEFRFVQGSDISEQGSGLQPLPNLPIPVFAYREQGALAGEGTALKVGDAVSTAEVWKEYAHPPYFVPYRGAVTSSAHLVAMPKATETWTVTKYPAALAAGAVWEMENDRHNHLVLKLERLEGAKGTFSFTDQFHPRNRMMLEAERAGDGWSTERVLYMPAMKGGEKHAASLTFGPGLSATGTSGTMEIGFAKKQKVVSATVTQSGDAGDRMVKIDFTAPAWTATKTVAEESKLSGDSAVVSQK